MNRIQSKKITRPNSKATSRTSRKSRAGISSPISPTWSSPMSVGSTNQARSLRKSWGNIKTQGTVSKGTLPINYTWKQKYRPSHPKISSIWSLTTAIPPPLSSALMNNDTITWSAEPLSPTTSTQTDLWSFSHQKNITKLWKLITSRSIGLSSMTSSTTSGRTTPRLSNDIDPIFCK